MSVRNGGNVTEVTRGKTLAYMKKEEKQAREVPSALVVLNLLSCSLVTRELSYKGTCQ